MKPTSLLRHLICIAAPPCSHVVQGDLELAVQLAGTTVRADELDSPASHNKVTSGSK